MKKTLRFLISLILIMTLIMPGAEAAKKGVVKGGKLRVRDAIDGNQLGSYENKTELVILEEYGKWLRVDGPAIKNGWVQKKYVTIGDECHPHAFDPDTETDVRQGDLLVTEAGAQGRVSWDIEYPEVNNAQADALTNDWVEARIADITKEEAAFAEESDLTADRLILKIRYSTYMTSERYQGVLLYGTVSRIKEEPEATTTKKKKKSKKKAEPVPEVTERFFMGFNVDTETGELLQGEELYADPSKILTKLEDAFAHDYSMELGTDLPTGDKTWLETGIITPQGLMVIMDAGTGTPESFGMHKVTVPYQTLRGTLAIDTTEAEKQTVIRDNCLYYPINPNIDPTKPMVALTFDDGPGPATEKILKVLRDNHCHATFCVVGSRVELYPTIMKEMVEDGNEICCHTWSHKRLDKMKKTAVADQLQKTIDAVERVTGGYRLTSLRPPYGLVTKNVKNACIDLGMTVYTWSLDTDDWISENPAKTLKRIQDGVENGSIILCHDIYDATAKATEQFIPWLIENGYQVVSVSEMMAYRANGMELGSSYSHMNPDNIVANPYE